MFLKLKLIAVNLCHHAFFLSVLWVCIYSWLPIPITWTMIDRKWTKWNDGKSSHINYDWISLDKLPKFMPLAVIASEDQKFTEHYGFDFESIFAAYEYNIGKRKRTIRGASTISQQTAKNVFLWQKRSYLRKLLEVYFTSLIELLWSKHRIMEVYLNVIECGDEVYGVQAASKKFFKIKPEKLNRDQAALIASVLPSPRRYKIHAPGKYLLERKQWILFQMNYLSCDDLYEK